MKRDAWGNYWRGIWVLELIENGGSTLAKNGTQNRDTDTHGGITLSFEVSERFLIKSLGKVPTKTIRYL